jgi:hypothetical protein
MSAQILHAMRELDSRNGDGMYVRLLWSEDDGGVAVSVTDAKTGDCFAIDVRAQDSASDVFTHPYAHVAWRGVDGDLPSRAKAPAGLLAA